jgi:hypothetical protein
MENYVEGFIFNNITLNELFFFKAPLQINMPSYFDFWTGGLKILNFEGNYKKLNNNEIPEELFNELNNLRKQTHIGKAI